MSEHDETVAKPVEVFEHPRSPYAIVWDTLSRVDVGDNIEVKGEGDFRLSYLSWTWAWATLMRHFPDSHYNFSNEEAFEDNSLSVTCEVIINTSTGPAVRRMWLPVMNHKNNAIPTPSARHVSDTRMRCLVKCLAMFGLGLDVYAGSDMPVGVMDDPISDDKAGLLLGMLSSLDEDAITRFMDWVPADSIPEIQNKDYGNVRFQLERKIKQAQS